MDSIKVTFNLLSKMQFTKFNYIENLIFIQLIFIVIPSFISFGESYNLFPTSVLFDLIFVQLFFFTLTKNYVFSITILYFSLLIFTYIFISFFFSFVIANDSLIDFLSAYKFYFYMLLLSLAPNTKIFSSNFFYYFFKFLIFSFFLKYFISFLFFNISRPGLFTENNFELMTISILFTFNLNINIDKFKKVDLILLFSIFLLSGSRSGIIIFLFLLLLNINRIKELLVVNKYNFKYLFLPFFLSLIILLVPLFARISTIENIDRFQFLLLFFNEFGEYTFIQKIFGPQRLTPLSDDTFSHMSHFIKYGMGSNKNPNEAYPFIFAPFIFRTILTHGILVSFFGIFILHKFLRYRIRTNSVTNQIILIGILNAFSVTSFQSVYFMFPTILICCHSIQYNESHILSN